MTQAQVVLKNLDLEFDYRSANGTAKRDGYNGGSYLEEDPVASAMEVPFGEYDVRRLHLYIANWYQRVFGREWDCPKAQAVNVLSGFIGRYGPEMAARIAQRLFLTYGGRWQGKPISIGTFSRPSRWITDRLEQELLARSTRHGQGLDFFSLSKLA